jgi:serine/threonine-protein kinase RsbW
MMPAVSAVGNEVLRPIGAAAAERKNARRHASIGRSDEVQALLDLVAAAMGAHCYPPRICWELRLALGEALANALQHGNGGDPSKQVRVEYRVGAADVLVEVVDEGTGFDAAAVPDPTAFENLDKPGGRGLLLMRHYATWVRHDGCGNRVTLCKHRVPA